MLVQHFLLEALESELGKVHVLSEEMREFDKEVENYWSIDPIDGTHNFIAGLPFYGISAAYIEDNRVKVGVIYLPEFNQLFYASEANGSFVNGVKMASSELVDLSKAIISYDNQFYLSDKSIANLNMVIDSSFTTRIHGSSVVDAAFVAQGKLSARIYNATKLCDIAAGSLLVEESGGKVTDFDGNDLDLKNVTTVIMSAEKIHQDLLTLLKS